VVTAVVTGPASTPHIPWTPGSHRHSAPFAIGIAIADIGAGAPGPAPQPHTPHGGRTSTNSTQTDPTRARSASRPRIFLTHFYAYTTFADNLVLNH
jgi:hypothetical protein